jgi:hypothetical protein
MGGPSDSAQRAAQAQQQQQQAAIDQSQAQINAIFDNPQRQVDIDDFVNATRQYYQQDLDKQKANADRSLKFALAKSGLTGGSEQVDQQEQLGEAYAKGQLQAEQKALGAGANLQDADEQARQRLIALATSGLDATNAATQSAEALRSDLQSARSQANADSLGNVFSVFNKFDQDISDAKQRRQGLTDSGFDVYGNPINRFNTIYGGGP